MKLGFWPWARKAVGEYIIFVRGGRDGWRANESDFWKLGDWENGVEEVLVWDRAWYSR